MNQEIFSRLKTGFSGDTETAIEYFETSSGKYPKFINAFWTAKQRQACSLHEIAYRACFKGQLPRFFLNILSKKGDVIYDPFSGRGTTIIEAALMGRQVIANDINPLSKILSQPRLNIPGMNKLETRLNEIAISDNYNSDMDLSMFFHPKTEMELISLKNYLSKRKKMGEEDKIDRWIRMVATNRLTGHSSGFFSVYTLPPNQALSQERQIKINNQRQQRPEYRNVKRLILKKSISLIKDLSKAQLKQLDDIYKNAVFLVNDAAKTDEINNDSIRVTITSPPFLDVVQYAKDNWLRCWFNEIDVNEIESKLSIPHSLAEWTHIMEKVFVELFRITQPGGWVAFEVGEVRNGKLKLEENVVPVGLNAGFECKGIVINVQKFTKTSNIWGVHNNTKGTNSNRIVLFYKNA